MKKALQGSLWGLVSLVAVYLPTFVLTSLVIMSGVLGKPSKTEAQFDSIPLIILISAGLALAYMALLAKRRGQSIAAYGFKTSAPRWLLKGLGWGLALTLVLRGLAMVLPLGAAADLGDLQRWHIVLFFWIGTPIQEELIFRGLVQTEVERRGAAALKLGKLALPFPVLVSALLFALVHIATARLGASLSQVLFTVGGAFVLGLLAAGLRQRSGSLLPCILVHALFNIVLGG
ncbi:MAG TPA: CPBP family intramembrane glutamic endopeptidase [Gammaproteobacteria bacterium]|nr:CPBP family intramembrane glutamic endopeptidase [Gammaproteobacteria bacterium]